MILIPVKKYIYRARTALCARTHAAAPPKLGLAHLYYCFTTASSPFLRFAPEIRMTGLFFPLTFTEVNLLESYSSADSGTLLISVHVAKVHSGR